MSGGGGQKKGLPAGWVETTLGEVATSQSGIGFPKHLQGQTDGRYPFIKVGDISRSIVRGDATIRSAESYVDDDIALKLRATPFPAGSVLFAKIGEGISLNRRVLTECDALADNNVMGLIPRAVTPRFLLQFMRSIDLYPFASATTVPSIRKSDIDGIAIRLPPLAEQRRIAAKLDDLLGRSRRAKEALAEIPALLDRYRQSVLAAAFCADLTADWRLQFTPKQWVRTLLKDVCHSLTDGDHQAPPQTREGIPFVTIGAMSDGKLRLERATRFVPESYFAQLKAERRPAAGDVLYSVTGSIGIAAIVDTASRFAFQRHIAILKPDAMRIISRFLCLRLSAEDIRQQAALVATGTAQMTIPLGGLRTLEFDLPSLPEQHEIVRRIDAAFARVDAVRATVDAELARLDALDRATLNRAFRGELVPQDPADEPASVLLDRIRKERSQMPAKGTRRPRVRPSPVSSVESSSLPDVSDSPRLPERWPAFVSKHGETGVEVSILYRSSGLSVDEFYRQLRSHVEAGSLREVRANEETRLVAL